MWLRFRGCVTKERILSVKCQGMCSYIRLRSWTYLNMLSQYIGSIFFLPLNLVICKCIYPSLSVFPSIYLSIFHLFIYAYSNYLFVYLFLYPIYYLPILSICLYLSIFTYISQSLSIWLSIWINQPIFYWLINIIQYVCCMLHLVQYFPFPPFSFVSFLHCKMLSSFHIV